MDREYVRILEHLGIEIKRYSTGRTFSACPLCRSEKSLSINEAKFFCYACRCRGDIYKFRKILFGDPNYQIVSEK